MNSKNRRNCIIATNKYEKYKAAFTIHRKKHPRKKETSDYIDTIFLPVESFHAENENGEEVEFAVLNELIVGNKAYIVAQRLDLGNGNNAVEFFCIDDLPDDSETFESVDEEYARKIRAEMKQQFMRKFHYLV